MATLVASCSSDPLARVEVRDGPGQLLAVGTGRVAVEVRRGLYEVRASAGGRVAGTTVSVPDGGTDARVELELGPYASAAPTLRSSTFDGAHVELLDRSADLVDPGGTCQLVVMLRAFGSRATSTSRDDFSIDLATRPLTWIEAAGAACTAVSAEEGVLVVRCGGGDPSAIAVPLWRGWQTTLFVPVVDDRPAMDHLALHCQPRGVPWSRAQGEAERTEQLAIAVTDRADEDAVRAAARGGTPLHALLGGDVEGLRRFDPAMRVAPADLAAFRIRAAPDGEASQVGHVEELPVLASTAVTLLHHEARHPWSLQGRLAASCATQLASSAYFRWRPGVPTTLHTDPDAWQAATDRFARRPPSIRHLERMSVDDDLEPAGQVLAAYIASSAYARRLPPGDVVAQPLRALVLTTGLPAAALHAALAGVGAAARRARLRRLTLTALAVLASIAVAILAWQLWPRDGDEVGTEVVDDTDTGVTELPTGIGGDRRVVVDEDAMASVELGGDGGGPVSVLFVSAAAHGTVGVSGSSLTYTPTRDFNGTDEFTYAVSDGVEEGGGVVTVEVRPVNDAPVATGEARQVEAGGVIEVAVLENDTDVDGDALQLVGVVPPSDIAEVVGDQVRISAPSTGGSTVLTYEISDGRGGTARADISVEVTPVQPPILAVDDEATTSVDTPIRVLVTENDDGLTEQTTVVIDEPGGSGEVALDGLVVLYTPGKGFVGTDAFTYHLEAEGEASAGATVTVTVLPTLVIGDASTNASSDGSTVAVTVRLSHPSTEPVTVVYETVDGTAVGGSDFVAAVNTLVFEPGDLEAAIPISVLPEERLEDGSFEKTETFTVELSRPTGASIEQGTATVSIYVVIID